MSNHHIIKTHCLEKRFDESNTNQSVLKNINLEIPKGHFTVVMGNSGSGKSTLLYLLSGLDTPSLGSIWLNDILIDNYSEKSLALFRRKHIGFVFQDHNLISNLTIRENILIAGYLTQEKKKVQKRTDELLGQLEISKLSNRYPREISGGERQRCAIARALINNPEILMLDEPTGNLNSSTSEKTLNSFKELNQSGQSVLMVTHDIKSACYGNNILFLKDGQIVETLNFSKSKNFDERQSILLKWLQSLGW